MKKNKACRGFFLFLKTAIVVYVFQVSATKDDSSRCIAATVMGIYAEEMGFRSQRM